MASHSNDDFGNTPEMNAAIRRILEDKATQMTRAGVNTITAGYPEEKPLYRDVVNGVSVTRLPDDPLALRISIGEGFVDDEDTAYVVFRGKGSDCIELLERALVAMRKAHEKVHP